MELNKTITMVEYTDYFLTTVKFLDIAETTKTSYRTFFNHIKYFFQRKKIKRHHQVGYPIILQISI